jgi:CHASE1-domain containing sensor protein
MVSLDKFDTFVGSLGIAEYLPGINGIGFIAPIAQGEEADFYQKLEKFGENRLTIKPETDGPERLIIERISPFLPNEQALGLDIAFETGRREAAEKARETGLPQLTPRILLVQDDTQQPGFLFLLPIYKNSQAIDEATSENFLGWVYAPFVGKNFLTGLTPDKGRAYHLAVYDGASANDDWLIYNSDPDGDDASRFNATHKVALFGRDWTVAFASTHDFDASYRNYVPIGILFAGIALTCMLAFSMRNQRIRNEALSEIAALRAKN